MHSCQSVMPSRMLSGSRDVQLPTPPFPPGELRNMDAKLLRAPMWGQFRGLCEESRSLSVVSERSGDQLFSRLSEQTATWIVLLVSHQADVSLISEHPTCPSRVSFSASRPPTAPEEPQARSGPPCDVPPTRASSWCSLRAAPPAPADLLGPRHLCDPNLIKHFHLLDKRWGLGDTSGRTLTFKVRTGEGTQARNLLM